MEYFANFDKFCLQGIKNGFQESTKDFLADYLPMYSDSNTHSERR